MGVDSLLAVVVIVVVVSHIQGLRRNFICSIQGKLCDTMLRRKQPVRRSASAQESSHTSNHSKEHVKTIDYALLVTRLLQAYLFWQTLFFISEWTAKCSLTIRRRAFTGHLLLEHSDRSRYSFAAAYKKTQKPLSNDEYNGPQRTFHKYPHSFPCADWEGAHSRSPTNEGFIYMKEMKTASSTLAGVTLRIARNVAKRNGRFNQTTFPMCRARFFHMRARKFQQRNRDKSFLWSVLREPNDRMLSKFFHFAVTRHNVKPTAQQFINYYNSYDTWIYDQAYYLKSLTVQEAKPRNSETYKNATQNVLDDYDFIGITERLDESLVVLQLLLGLQTQDILYISSKSSESFEFHPAGQDCLYLAPKFDTPDIRSILQSPEWINYTLADQMLYQAANKSLDCTIDYLGQNVVKQQLRKFKWAQALVQKSCIDKVVFPCTSDGKDQATVSDCLYQDAGCGFMCLDEVGEKLSSLPEFQAFDSW